VYYDNNKLSRNGKFEAETRLSLSANKHYTPDIVCGCSSSLSMVFCVEVYNGNKVGYAEKQIIQLF
jgi:hypothetical protein